eukprot:Protomagalhaensia_sp_Gyna_25__1220@NODE_1606_length_1695_cov_38_373188_g1312_i0_p1_GENE_NODE_1606_length_1695_cov_38_373188_g1312_i0NODE_1606_length_1695_cov_38_373188_g1312_i0_p1_ORF_typecomplete_len148_score13_44_NODE_1606_length_1695_cov_38_373188_g1312_i08881331
MLSDTTDLRSLTWEQSYVVHIYLLRRLGVEMEPNSEREMACIRLLQEARLARYSEGVPMVKRNQSETELILRGYVQKCDSSILGSWTVIRGIVDGSLSSQESVLSLSTTDLSTIKPATPITAGRGGCLTLLIEESRLREAYGVSPDF